MKKKTAGKPKLTLGIIFIVLCLVLGYSIAMRRIVSNGDYRTEPPNELQEIKESVSTAEVQVVETAENSPSSPQQQGSDDGEVF